MHEARKCCDERTGNDLRTSDTRAHMHTQSWKPGTDSGITQAGDFRGRLLNSFVVSVGSKNVVSLDVLSIR
jgi:hypothetical protein